MHLFFTHLQSYGSMPEGQYGSAVQVAVLGERGLPWGYVGIPVHIHVQLLSNTGKPAGQCGRLFFLTGTQAVSALYKHKTMCTCRLGDTTAFTFLLVQLCSWMAGGPGADLDENEACVL